MRTVGLVWICFAAGACLGPNPAFNEPREATESGGGSGSGSGSASTGEPDGSSTAGSGGEAGGSQSAEGEAEDEGNETSGGPIDASCDVGDSDLLLCFDFEAMPGGMLLDGSMYGTHAAASDVDLVASPWGRGIETTAQTRIEVPCFERCELDDQMTFEARVRFDAFPPPGRRVGIVDNDREYAITYSAAAGLRCAIAGVELNGPVLEPGTWAHVACTYDGEILRAYIDGVEVMNATATGPAGPGDPDPIAVANTAPDWDEPLIGALDRLRIWRRALEPDEICAEAGC